MFIDPGDSHVGFSHYSSFKDGWQATAAEEFTPQSVIPVIKDWVQEPNLMILGWERFALFPHLAKQQIGSEFKTSQLIGVLRYLANEYGHPNLEVVIQQPSIQPPTEAVAKHRKLKLLSVETNKGPHAKSAELHTLFYLFQNNQTIYNWSKK